jgi:hypothetical protein
MARKQRAVPVSDNQQRYGEGDCYTSFNFDKAALPVGGPKIRAPLSCDGLDPELLPNLSANEKIDRWKLHLRQALPPSEVNLISICSGLQSKECFNFSLMRSNICI